MSQYWIERGVLGPLSSRCMSWNLAFPLLLNKSKINYLFILNKPDYCFCIYSDPFHITTWLNSTFKIKIFKNLKSKLGNKYIRLMLLNLFKFRSQLSKKRSLRGGEGEAEPIELRLTFAPQLVPYDTKFLEIKGWTNSHYLFIFCKLRKFFWK